MVRLESGRCYRLSFDSASLGVIFFFFFYGSGPPRVLLSSPPRPSPDLLTLSLLAPSRPSAGGAAFDHSGLCLRSRTALPPADLVARDWPAAARCLDRVDDVPVAMA